MAAAHSLISSSFPSVHNYENAVRVKMINKVQPKSDDAPRETTEQEKTIKTKTKAEVERQCRLHEKFVKEEMILD